MTCCDRDRERLSPAVSLAGFVLLVLLNSIHLAIYSANVCFRKDSGRFWTDLRTCETCNIMEDLVTRYLKSKKSAIRNAIVAFVCGFNAYDSSFSVSVVILIRNFNKKILSCM